RAAELVGAAPLAWTGVFVNEPVADVASRASDLHLSAVQLHGGESSSYVAELRARLPADCAIWRASRIPPQPVEAPPRAGHLVLLDRSSPDRKGGTGQTFDWSLLAALDDPSRFILSGGLTAENVSRANATPIEFLDVNSGVESAPGEKDPAQLDRFFAARR